MRKINCIFIFSFVFHRQQLEAIAEVIRSHPRLLVLSDEIYEYIVYKPAEHHSIGTMVRNEGTVILLSV